MSHDSVLWLPEPVCECSAPYSCCIVVYACECANNIICRIIYYTYICVKLNKGNIFANLRISLEMAYLLEYIRCVFGTSIPYVQKAGTENIFFFKYIPKYNWSSAKYYTLWHFTSIIQFLIRFLISYVRLFHSFVDSFVDKKNTQCFSWNQIKNYAFL